MKYLALIHNALDLGLSNALSEAANTHLRLLTRRAYGYHSPDALIAMATLKSSRSTGTGNCVEVAAFPGGHRAVRDSKHPTGPALTFTAAEWTAFTTGVRTGEFD